METTTKYTLDALTPESVSILKQVFDANTAQPIHSERRAYINTPSERNILKSEIPDEVYSDLIRVWGDTPALDDYVMPIPSLEERKRYAIANMSDQCNKAITAGFDAIMTDGRTYHFSLKLEDQLMIQALMLKVNAGESALPYHADGETCRYFSPDEIKTLYNCTEARIVYNTTYFNSLRDYINSIDDSSELSEVSYGMEIPEEFKSDVLKMLEAN